jgi:hypothetical protein
MRKLEMQENISRKEGLNRKEVHRPEQESMQGSPMSKDHG